MQKKLQQFFLFSLFFVLMFNGQIFYSEYKVIKSAGIFAIIELAKNLVYVILGLTILFFGLSFSRTLFYLISFLLFFTSALASYYINAFGIKITPEIIKIVLHNDPADGFELLSIQFILWMLFSIISWYFACRKISKHEIFASCSVGRRISLLALLGSCYFLFLPEFKIYKTYLPWQITSSITSYIKNIKNAAKVDVSLDHQFSMAESEPKNIILVIGESARYGNFGINGYERDTTPNLSKIPNLHSFYANSCASMTYLSVSCLLSRKNSAEFDINENETTIISIFNKLGFETGWFGTQNISRYFDGRPGGSFYVEPKIVILPGGSALYKLNDYDEMMLPFIRDFIEKQNSNKFLVIHTIGSHWDYQKRYPKDFEIFTPICKSSLFGKQDPTNCSRDELVNIYDNSILYTDYFLSQLIALLENTNSFLIYASDHAVSLGEEGRYGQGGTAKEQFEIPMLVWGSNEFFKKNPDYKRYIGSYIGKNLSHDYIFHSLLGCSSISSDILDSKYNLCGPQK